MLFGPTAVGKTAMTEALFSGSAEIISADSVQVYRGFDIGSAKPDGHLLRLIPHHLIDIRDPWEQYTAGDFVRDAESLIPQIISRGRIPLITGGTAYYFRQLICGPSEAPKSDPEVRESVRKEIEEKGRDWAYSYLGEIDPVSHGRIAAADIYRISRAIEVYRSSGRPLSSFAASSAPDADYTLICLVRDKAELSERIEKRVEEMFRLGLYDEVRELFNFVAHCHDVGRLKRNAAADASHGKPHMRAFERRRIVDAVADHQHLLPAAALILDIFKLGLRQTVADDLINAGQARRMQGCRPMVACQKNGRHAQRPKR